MFRIELIKPEIPFFQQINAEKKIFLVTSQWSAKWLVLNAVEIGFTQTDKIFCLSEKQEKIWLNYHNKIFVSDEKNAVSLANWLNQKLIMKI